MVTDLVETVGESGVVMAEPRDIAAKNGVSLDVEALARLAVSEATTRAGRIAVMWATRNYAKRAHLSIAELLLRSKHPLASGKFSRQNLGKYASTALPSTTETRTDAARVLSGVIRDPTGGATQYDCPAAQGKLQGQRGYTKTADEVAETRARDSVLVTLPGVPGLRFWKPKRSA